MAFLLYSYKLRLNRLRLLLESDPALDLLGAPTWQRMPRVEWSAEKQACLVASVRASIRNESCHCESVRPFVSVPESEAAQSAILQAMEHGDNVLLTGQVVRRYI